MGMDVRDIALCTKPMEVPPFPGSSDDDRLVALISDRIFAAVAKVEDDYPDADREVLARIIMHVACNVASGRDGVTRLLSYMRDHYRIGQPPIIIEEE